MKRFYASDADRRRDFVYCMFFRETKVERQIKLSKGDSLLIHGIRYLNTHGNTDVVPVHRTDENSSFYEWNVDVKSV